MDPLRAAKPLIRVFLSLHKCFWFFGVSVTAQLLPMEASKSQHRYKISGPLLLQWEEHLLF